MFQRFRKKILCLFDARGTNMTWAELCALFQFARRTFTLLSRETVVLWLRPFSSSSTNETRRRGPSCWVFITLIRRPCSNDLLILCIYFLLIVFIFYHFLVGSMKYIEYTEMQKSPTATMFSLLKHLNAKHMLLLTSSKKSFVDPNLWTLQGDKFTVKPALSPGASQRLCRFVVIVYRLSTSKLFMSLTGSVLLSCCWSSFFTNWVSGFTMLCEVGQDRRSCRSWQSADSLYNSDSVYSEAV